MESEPLPLVPIVLQAGRRRLAGAGLVDSGSESSFIGRETADLLGLAPRAPIVQVRTMGGLVDSRPATLSLELRLPHGPFTFPEARFLIPESGDEPRVVILGRELLFSQCEIRFVEWRNLIGIVRRRRAWRNHGVPRLARPEPSP